MTEAEILEIYCQTSWPVAVVCNTTGSLVAASNRALEILPAGLGLRWPPASALGFEILSDMPVVGGKYRKIEINASSLQQPTLTSCPDISTFEFSVSSDTVDLSSAQYTLSSTVKQIVGTDVDIMRSLASVFKDTFAHAVATESHVANFTARVPASDGSYLALEGLMMVCSQRKVQFLTWVSKNTGSGLTSAVADYLINNFLLNTNIPMGVSLPSKRWVSVNEALCAMLGASADELLHSDWVDFTHPDDRARSIETYQRQMASGIGAYSVQKRFVRKDGTTVYAQLAVTLIRSEQGETERVLTFYIDRTAEKQNQDDVRDREMRYEIASQLTGQILYEYDIPSGVLIWQGAIRELTGYTIEEFRLLDLDGWASLVHPDHRQRVLQQFLDACTTVGDYVLEYKFRHKKGMWIDIYERGKTVENRNGIPVKAYGTMTDMTDIYRTSRRLHEIELRWDGIVNNIPNIVLMVNADGVIMYSNREDIFSSSAQPVSLYSLVSDHCGYTLKALFASSLQTGRHSDGEVLFLTSSGFRWFSVRVAAIQVATGNADYVVVLDDIHEKKERQTELRATQKRLELHYEHTPAAILEYDENGTIKAWNPGAERMFGWSQQEALGRNAFSLVVPEEIRTPITDLASSVFHRRETVDSLNENITKSGRRIVCYWMNTPLYDEHDHLVGVTSFAVDVTEQHKARQAVEEQRTYFENITNAVSTIIATYSIENASVEYCNDVKIGPATGYTPLSLTELLPTLKQKAPAFFACRRDRQYAETDIALEDSVGVQRVVRLRTKNVVINGKELLLLTIDDMTERAKTLRLLDQALTFNKTIVDNASVLVVVLSADGTVMRINDAAQKLSGWSEKDAVGKSFLRIFIPEEEHEAMQGMFNALVADGKNTKYENEWVSKDGRYFLTKWDNTVVRNADGEVEYIISTGADVTQERRLQRILDSITEGTSAVVGERFFSSLTYSLVKVLNGDIAFVGVFDDDLSPHKVRTIAIGSPEGLPIENFEYDLEHTPCSDVLDDDACAIAEGVQRMYPKDELLAEMGINGYVGTVLRDSQKRPLGLVVVLYKKKVESPDLAVQSLQIFASRAAAELERLKTDRERQQLSEVVEHTSDFVGFANRSGEVLYLNWGGRRMWGMGDSESWSGLKVSDFHPDDITEKILVEGMPIADTGMPFRIESQLKRKDGTLVPVSQLIWAHIGESGNAEYYYTVMRDMTEREEAEREIRKSEQLLREAGRVARLGAWEFNVDTRQVRWSEEIFLIHGLEPADPFIDPSIFHALYDADSLDRLRIANQRAIEQGANLEEVVFITRPSGQQAVLRVVGKAEKDDKSGKVHRLYGVTKDITEQYTNEQLIKEQLQQLSDKNSELARFIYTVSHDLKSPLITIKGFLGYVFEDIEAGRVSGIESDLRRVENAANKMQNLLEDLLELSRIGRVINPSEKISLSALVLDVVELLHGPISAARAQVAVDRDMGYVLADRVRMSEVFQNLIENAVKFRREDVPPIIEIRSEDRGSHIVCYVSDNGIGIPEQHFDRIFGLFEKIHTSTDGTGIGLALVKRIIELHGGDISVKSTVGRGTEFRILIPKNPHHKHVRQGPSGVV